MSFIDTSTLEECTEQQVRSRFPNVTFATNDFPPGGYAEIIETAPPEYEALTHECRPVGVNALFERQWVVTPLGQDEIDRRAAYARAMSVPPSVSRFQARAALYQAGLLAKIEAYMAGPDVDPIAKLAWQDAQEFRRTSPTVAALAALLGLSDAALDELFTAAAQIKA